jgi:hypothetical protein
MECRDDLVNSKVKRVLKCGSNLLYQLVMFCDRQRDVVSRCTFDCGMSACARLTQSEVLEHPGVHKLELPLGRK